jgi:DNA-binding NarL/FixJ family response regulator
VTDQTDTEGEGPRPDHELKVMVVDDHPLWRDGLRAGLEQGGGASVVAEASDGGEAIELARQTMPEVVVMDLHLPTVSGVEATRQIIDESPHVKVLILSATGEESEVLEAVKAGASGYMLKSDATAAEVVAGVRRVAEGEPVFSPSLAGLVLNEFRRLASKDPSEPGLTARENEVLKYVAKGYTYPEIGKKLFISTKTVQNHVQNILTKLQMHNRWELMRDAILKGIDRLPE